MKFILNSLILVLCISTINAAPLSDELVVIHNVTTAEMNAITSPIQGSLIFNTDDSEVYERNATAWHMISSDGSETKIVAGNCMDITGIGTTANPYVTISLRKGETQTTAGLICKEIFDTAGGCPVKDGIYWINPDGGSTANAFEVFCDMNGGGWTKIEYATDLVDKKYFGSGDAWRWLTQNFQLVLTDTQINNIRAISTEGKQTYIAQCDGVITYYYQTGNNYTYAFGYRLHTGFETNFGQVNYPGINLSIIQDGCSTNRTDSLHTIIDINDTRIPLINVYSRDNGGTTETFGSPLTSNPAWFR
jgi:hypothetical protein